jgi:hypothetical protein
MALPPAPTAWSAWAPGLAIAASFVVALGSVAFFLARSSPSLPQPIEVAAIERHDHCCNAADHHAPTIPQASFPRLGQYLRQELDHPILAANLEKEGWRFSGAAICPVGNVRAAHLLYRRSGYQTLSVFSLPASSFPSLQNNETYEGTIDGHAVVARSENGAVYCLVGYCPEGELSVAEVGRMLNEYEGEATIAAVTGARVEVAGVIRE